MAVWQSQQGGDTGRGSRGRSSMTQEKPPGTGHSGNEVLLSF